MKQFTMRLAEDYGCPVLILRDFHNLTALIDTGAVIPVITLTEESVRELGGTLKQENIVVKGLTQKRSTGSIYTLNNFRVGEILFTEIDFAVLPDTDAQYAVLLSSSMFRGMIYEIDDINHRFNVSVSENDCIRRLLAYYDKEKDKLYVHCNV